MTAAAPALRRGRILGIYETVLGGCLLAAPFLLSLFALTAPLFGGTNLYEALGETTGIGLVRSAVFAWLVVRLSGWMRSRGVRVQL